MKVLIAMDSFKGNLTATEAGEAVRRGVLRACPAAETRLVPVADGGEGTVEAFVAALGGEVVRTEVRGPMGVSVEGIWGRLADGRAVIELAAASGLPLVPRGERNPMAASTWGTGEQIRAALDAGCRSLVLGLGGSATVDGGMGLLAALGARALDERGDVLVPCGASLKQVERLDLSGLDGRLADVRWLVMCDVKNVLCGPEGAAAVFGPQKGANGSMIERLDRGLANWASVLKRATGHDVTKLAGGGAAGGVAAGLAGALGISLTSGIEVVAAVTGLAKAMRGADLTFTGEGRIDGQTGLGKVVAGLARYAQIEGVPLVALVGSLRGSMRPLMKMGLSAVFPIGSGPSTFVQALRHSEEDLERTASQVTRLVMRSRRGASRRGARRC